MAHDKNGCVDITKVKDEDTMKRAREFDANGEPSSGGGHTKTKDAKVALREALIKNSNVTNR